MGTMRPMMSRVPAVLVASVPPLVVLPPVATVRAFMPGSVVSAVVAARHLQKHCLQCPSRGWQLQLVCLVPERMMPESKERVGFLAWSLLLAVKNARLKKAGAACCSRNSLECGSIRLHQFDLFFQRGA